MKRSVSLLLSEDVGSGTRTRSVSMSSSTSPSCNKSSKARKTNSLPTETVEYLKSWMMSPEHIAHPYPTDLEKAQIMADTGIELKQLTNWFVNNRKRFWKPRVESRLVHDGVSGQVSAPVAVTPEQTIKTIVPMDSLSLKSAMMTDFLDDTSKSGMSPSSSSSSLSSPARVSDQSVMSETDSLSSSEGSSVEDELLLMPTSGGQDSSEEPTNLIVQTERVNVHILLPGLGSTPTVEDVTVLNNVPGDRVLKSFLNCTLTYTVPNDAINNSHEIQCCREAEIRKLKVEYLEGFLASQPSTPKKRRADDHERVDLKPRQKFRRPSLVLWRDACSTSNSFYDHALPSLEEAAALFGFASS